MHLKIGQVNGEKSNVRIAYRQDIGMFSWRIELIQMEIWAQEGTNPFGHFLTVSVRKF